MHIARKIIMGRIVTLTVLPKMTQVGITHVIQPQAARNATLDGKAATVICVCSFYIFAIL